MSASAVAGIVFGNVQDEVLEALTTHRAMAAVPFGARYRLVDFPLSNLVSADVCNVGLVVKEKYRSLLDHVGSGIYWDLDRKSGGLHLMPPYLSRGVRRYSGFIEALYGAMDFVKRCGAEYVVTYDSGVIANVDLTAAIRAHIAKSADITVVYTHGDKPACDMAAALCVRADGRITAVEPAADLQADYSMGVMLFRREVLEQLVTAVTEIGRNEIADLLQKYRVFGFRHDGFSALMADMESYYKANMALLNVDIRRDLFCADRPILTKTRDDMPTRYGTHAKVENCFIADGCVIDGSVKNSILFRGVHVEKGAVVENCILMQGTTVRSSANLDRLITDKGALVGPDMVLHGTSAHIILIGKNQMV